mgnify:CR=1 FL=1
MNNLIKLNRKIEAVKKRLSLKKEICENFGQNDIRKLKDFAKNIALDYYQEKKLLDVVSLFDDKLMRCNEPQDLIK